MSAVADKTRSTMGDQLKLSIGQYSDQGRKEINQDFYGVYIPKEPLLSTKGIAIALADGISSSEVSQIASKTAVMGFLEDYYSTSDAWSVKTSVQRVLSATNSWLYAQTRQSQYRYERDRGYVCTFSTLIIKSNTAHLFHAGDTRIYRLQEGLLEQLTEDHRLWISRDQNYLNRALGIGQQLEIDYRELRIEKGDIFLLATDGVYEFIDEKSIARAIRDYGHDLNEAARVIVSEAFDRGSDDNLSVQIVSVDQLPKPAADELIHEFKDKPFPPMLSARMEFDGYRILRELHISSRSHVYLAVDLSSDEQVALKMPSVDLRGDRAYLDRFQLEEWVARRIDNAHVVKAVARKRKRNYFYSVSEYVEGQSLAQWMADHPNPDIETVRNLVEQIAKGLQAFHRLEMLHQDLRPNNIIIDKEGTVKILDFGSASVAGLAELTGYHSANDMLGTAQYMAPEYFLGNGGTTRSDLFSLAVITYQLISGRLPYGAEVAKARTAMAQRKLRYQSVLSLDSDIPVWIDETLKKALQPDPNRRYQEISEFLYDLRRPNPEYLRKTRPPLLERNPVVFWQGISMFLFCVVVGLIVFINSGH